ncbi:unnamed protein product [Protopolystoma xenopodis]|uniref:Uncharacterized protein n=1 Tax=Protopolystoma xenopodis TaxID=117903 RepID=A0A3S5FBM4_9PLAT|nr:unnamed protein product [Protopolystoma xenopodis]
MYCLASHCFLCFSFAESINTPFLPLDRLPPNPGWRSWALWKLSSLPRIVFSALYRISCSTPMLPPTPLRSSFLGICASLPLASRFACHLYASNPILIIQMACASSLSLLCFTMSIRSGKFVSLVRQIDQGGSDTENKEGEEEDNDETMQVEREIVLRVRQRDGQQTQVEPLSSSNCQKQRIRIVYEGSQESDSTKQHPNGELPGEQSLLTDMDLYPIDFSVLNYSG